MELHQIKYFVSLARTKSFSKAADRVHVSQPALSQQIKKLEKDLGVSLVERMGRSIKLTKEGQTFLPEAMKILDSVRSARSSIASETGASKGTFKFGVIPTIAPYLLPKILETFDPDPDKRDLLVEEQQTDTLIEQLKIGEVDHLLLSPPIPEDRLVVESIGSEPFFLAIQESDPLAQRGSISLDGLENEPILLLEEGHCLRDQTISFCDRNDFNPNVVFQGSSLQSILNLVKAGFGYTFVPEMVVDQENYRDLAFVPFKEPKPEREIILVHRKSTTLNEGDREFYRIVRESFQQENNPTPTSASS